MGTWDLNFLQRPDSVTGLQRRTGSYLTEFKSNLQERILKEHLWDTSDSVPQLQHGIHREGSAVAFVTVLDAADPTERPHDASQTPVLLDDYDRGRVLIKEERDLYYWKDGTDKWVKLELTQVSAIQIWPASVAPTNWMICDGTLLQRDEYPALFAVVGVEYGTESSADFRIPDLQGLSVMGQGQQDIDSRTKGYVDPVATVKEDRIQTLEGSVLFNMVYPDANISLNHTGIFKAKTSGGSQRSKLDRAPGDHAAYGFEIDLDNPTEPMRHGAFGHPSVMLMNFIIKVL